jgi:selenocysteine lyase/cysteine desulfurase
MAVVHAVLESVFKLRSFTVVALAVRHASCFNSEASVAVDYAFGLGLADIAGRIETLAGELRRLAAFRSLSNRGRRRCGVVTFTDEGKPPRILAAALHRLHINCHASGPSSPLLVAPARRLPALVRASVHYYNTEDEVARFARGRRAGLASGGQDHQ